MRIAKARREGAAGGGDLEINAEPAAVVRSQRAEVEPRNPARQGDQGLMLLGEPVRRTQIPDRHAKPAGLLGSVRRLAKA